MWIIVCLFQILKSLINCSLYINMLFICLTICPYRLCMINRGIDFSLLIAMDEKLIKNSIIHYFSQMKLISSWSKVIGDFFQIIIGFFGYSISQNFSRLVRNRGSTTTICSDCCVNEGSSHLFFASALLLASQNFPTHTCLWFALRAACVYFQYTYECVINGSVFIRIITERDRLMKN